MVLGEVSDKTRIPKGLGPVSCWGGGGGGITEVGSELLLWIAGAPLAMRMPFLSTDVVAL
jgi:hypothetical protein